MDQIAMDSTVQNERAATAIVAGSDEDYARLLHDAEEIATLNERLRQELRGIDGTLRHVRAELEHQKAYSAKLRELATLRSQLNHAEQREHSDNSASFAEEAFAGHPDRDCAEHRTAGARAWCFDCSEWCSQEASCKGCELPHVRDELRRAQGELADWRTTFDASALREQVARAEHDVSAFEASQVLLCSATDTIADLRARLTALPEWRCPGCGATTRARMADGPAESTDHEEL